MLQRVIQLTTYARTTLEAIACPAQPSCAARHRTRHHRTHRSSPLSNKFLLSSSPPPDKSTLKIASSAGPSRAATTPCCGKDHESTVVAKIDTTIIRSTLPNDTTAQERRQKPPNHPTQRMREKSVGCRMLEMLAVVHAVTVRTHYGESVDGMMILA
jgi:hypothetical protein